MEKLDLTDVSIHEKDWKAFKKSATQEELLILGLGVKYKKIKSRPFAVISLQIGRASCRERVFITV